MTPGIILAAEKLYDRRGCMKHLTPLLGILIGLTGGSLLIAYPMAAAFGRTTVTWSAESCPAGNYTIQATATHTGSGQTFEFRSSAILPRGQVAAEFNDLPAGQYSVRMDVRRGDGTSFSATQGLNVGAEGAVDGRVRISDGREITGSARPRSAGGDGSLGAFRAPGFVAPATPTPAPAPSRPAVVPARPKVATPTTPVAPEIADRVLPIFARLRALTAAGHDWTRAEVIDADADGEPDAISVEFADGLVLSWALAAVRK